MFRVIHSTKKWILRFCFIFLLLSITLPYQATQVSNGMKETYIEYYRLKIDKTLDYSVIGGHYTYFFSDHLAIGPGFFVPAFNMKRFNLGVLFHGYYYPFTSGPALPFVYLETGVQLGDYTLPASAYGLSGNQEFLNWGGIVRVGAGASMSFSNSPKFSWGARAMVYYSTFLLHYVRPLPERSSIFVAVGMYVAM